MRLRRATNKEQSFNEISELTELKDIKKLYETIDSETLKIIYYRMIKEKNGSGMIPIFVTTIPWLLFMFSNQIQRFLFKEGSLLWVAFTIIYLCILTLSVILHFREKAWAETHIEIIQDIIKARKDEKN
nr:hypothetical protein [Bacillus sp. B15-48]